MFDRPAGDGYPVGIEWGFFLAFVAAGSLAYAGWRMRASERPEAPARAGAPRAARARARRRPSPSSAATDGRDARAAPAARERTGRRRPASEPEQGAPAEVLVPATPAARRTQRAARAAPLPAGPRRPEQLSFEDPPAHEGG